MADSNPGQLGGGVQDPLPLIWKLKDLGTGRETVFRVRHDAEEQIVSGDGHMFKFLGKTFMVVNKLELERVHRATKQKKKMRMTGFQGEILLLKVPRTVLDMRIEIIEAPKDHELKEKEVWVDPDFVEAWQPLNSDLAPKIRNPYLLARLRQDTWRKVRAYDFDTFVPRLGATLVVLVQGTAPGDETSRKLAFVISVRPEVTGESVQLFDMLSVQAPRNCGTYVPAQDVPEQEMLANLPERLFMRNLGWPEVYRASMMPHFSQLEDWCTDVFINFT